MISKDNLKGITKTSISEHNKNTIEHHNTNFTAQIIISP